MARGNAVDMTNRFLLSMLFVGIVLLYWTVVPRMAREWWNDPNYSHGLLVPVFSAYLLWEKRNLLAPFRDTRSSLPGVLIVLLGTVLLILGKAGGEFFTMRSSLIFVMAGLFRIVFGADGFRKCLFPIGFLFFMVPIPYILYDAAAFPLKMIASWIGEHALAAIAVPVLREGNLIHLPNFQMEVADACSGIRSLMSLFAMSAAASHVLGLNIFKGIILFVSAVPVSLGTNSLRIVVTGFLANRYGRDAAEGFFHDFSGWLIFLSGAFLVFLLGLLLARIRFSRNR